MATTFLAFERDYMSASALATGMWQALLCTAGSLILAIPAHVAHHFLSGRVRSIVRDIEWSGNEMMRYLQNDYRGLKPVGSEAVEAANRKAPSQEVPQ
jgi:biopolymer transport protein ExbB